MVQKSLLILVVKLTGDAGLIKPGGDGFDRYRR